MISDIKTIILGGLAGNCYLIKNHSGFILIDTGGRTKRKKLLKELNDSGCNTNNLKLIILTHGDFDHSGNCAYLKEVFKPLIAMHKNDLEIVQLGKKSGSSLNPIKRIINSILGIKPFSPDFTVEDGYNLKEFGLNARIICLPGHSEGSIGVLTDNGDLFCGDLFINKENPKLNRIAINKREQISSLWKLKNLYISTVYPGHGKPFPIESLKR